MAAFFILQLAFLFAPALVGAQSITPFPGLSCAAPDYIVEAIAGGLFPGYYCTEDPCSSTINACGTGNICTTREALFPGNNVAYFADCQCKAPYVPTTVTIGTFVQVTTCYIPGQDACNPNPCLNGGTCNTVGKAPDGTPVYPQCTCRRGFNGGRFCQLPNFGPVVLATAHGVTGQLAQAVGGFDIDQYCGNTPFPFGCLTLDQTKYVCCTVGCGPYDSDGATPLCRGDRFIPQPNDYHYPTNIPQGPPNQGSCGGGGYALDFPVRCFFNENPQQRYVCCDAAGCDGFNADGVTPHCKNNGYVPPGFGVYGLLPLASTSTTPTATTGAPVATAASPTSAPAPAAAPASKTLVPPSTECPPVDGFYTNSCYNRNGSMHVCCLNPDSCGPFDANDNPTCTNGRYYVFS